MKKLSLGFVAVFMFLAIFSVTCFAEGSAPKLEGNVYHIKTVENLIWVAEQTHSGNDFNGYEVRLDNDIVCLDRTFTTEIGTETTNFNGCFNGNSKILSFKSVQTNSGAIFGYIGQSGKVMLLNIGYESRSGLPSLSPLNSSLSPLGATCLKNADPVGKVSGLAYKNYGIITNCRFGADLVAKWGYAVGVAYFNYGTVSDCIVEGDVKVMADSDLATASGVTVINYGKILNCSVKSCVQAHTRSFRMGVERSRAHGITDANYGTVKHCCVYDKVIAEHSFGISWYNKGEILDCQVSRKCCRNAKVEYVERNEGTLKDCAKFFFYPW